MFSLRFYSFAFFVLAVFGMGNAIGDNNTEDGKNDDLNHQHFFIKGDDETLSIDGKEPGEEHHEKTIPAQYDQSPLFRSNKEPVKVGTWTTSPMDFSLNITIKTMSLWWEALDDEYEPDCEWTFYIHHNDQQISENTEACQSNGEDLVRETYDIGISIDLNNSDTFAIEIWYEGWEDVKLYYDNLTYDSGSGIECENSCDPIPEAIIDFVSHEEAENGNLVEFSGSGNSINSQISAYLWESSIDGELSNVSQFNTTNLSFGRHIIYFSVVDSEGYNSSKITTPLWIYAKPIALANYVHWNDLEPKSVVKPGEEVVFKGNGSDEDGAVILYEWDFNGDGEYDWSSGDKASTTFIYNNEGTYTATFRVSDNDGFTTTDSRVIVVSEKPVQIDEEGNVTEVEESEDSLPSISLIPALISIGLLAILRRKN